MLEVAGVQPQGADHVDAAHPRAHRHDADTTQASQGLLSDSIRSWAFCGLRGILQRCIRRHHVERRLAGMNEDRTESRLKEKRSFKLKAPASEHKCETS